MSDEDKGALILSSYIPPGGRANRNPCDDRRIVNMLLASGKFPEAMGTISLYTSDANTAIEDLMWFKIAKAEYLLRGGQFNEAVNCVGEALARRDLFSEPQVAQALRLKANALKSQNVNKNITNPIMMEASNLDGKASYWNWLGPVDGKGLYAWIREDASEEVKKDFNERIKTQAWNGQEKSWRTYTIC
jgi:hypothetical protein